jgi:hypothetical protein
VHADGRLNIHTATAATTESHTPKTKKEQGDDASVMRQKDAGITAPILPETNRQKKKNQESKNQKKPKNRKSQHWTKKSNFFS